MRRCLAWILWPGMLIVLVLAVIAVNVALVVAATDGPVVPTRTPEVAE